MSSTDNVACGCASSPGRADAPIACTLQADDMPSRLAEWRKLLAPVVVREAIDGGVRLVFPPGASLAPVVELAGAEQACCAFFRFAFTIDNRGAALEVTAPAEALEIVNSLFGAQI